MDTTSSDHLCTFGNRVLKLADFLLPLLLRTNHEKPHNGKDGHHHEQH